MEYEQASYALAKQARINKEESDKRERSLAPSQDPETQIRGGDSQKLGAGSTK
jgi:hypothetical protein